MCPALIRYANDLPDIPAIEEWEVDMSFPAESDLQKSLENLAATWRDGSDVRGFGGLVFSFHDWTLALMGPLGLQAIPEMDSHSCIGLVSRPS